MTLIIGIIANDGIVFVSDSRMTTGVPEVSATQANDTVQKIFRITDHAAMAISGSGETAVTLIEKFQKEVEEKENQKLDIKELVEMFRTLAREHYDDWFQKLSPESKNIPSFSVLIGGYTLNERRELQDPKIIRMSSKSQFAPMTTTPGFATGGVYTLANYLLNRLYIRGEITMEQALVLGAFCVMETQSQDGRVGGSLQVAKFSTRDKFVELDEKKIKKLTNRCEEVLRDSFQVPFYKEAGEEAETAIAREGDLPEKDAVKVKKDKTSKK